METKKCIYLVRYLFWFVAILPMSVFAQQEYKNEINKFNKNNQKEGFWIEESGQYFRSESYYKNGKRNGIFKSYNTGQGTLRGLLEYKDGELCGVAYSFGDKGHLDIIFKDFAVNTDVITESNITYKHTCYTITFHPNGNKESEGVLLWQDNPELDNTYEYGEWKYYDNAGKLVKTEHYK